MGLGRGMSRNIFKAVLRAFVILVLDNGNKDCNLFWMYVVCACSRKYSYVPHVLHHHFRHGSDSSTCQVTLVFLQHVQIFRLLLKISVEENNWMSLLTNFSSPCLSAGHPTTGEKKLCKVFTTYSKLTKFPREKDCMAKLFSYSAKAKLSYRTVISNTQSSRKKS